MSANKSAVYLSEYMSVYEYVCFVYVVWMWVCEYVWIWMRVHKKIQVYTRQSWEYIFLEWVPKCR